MTGVDEMHPAQRGEGRVLADRGVHVGQSDQVSSPNSKAGVMGSSPGRRDCRPCDLHPLNTSSYPTSFFVRVLDVHVQVSAAVVDITDGEGDRIEGFTISMNGKLQWSCTALLSGTWLYVFQ